MAKKSTSIMLFAGILSIGLFSNQSNAQAKRYQAVILHPTGFSGSYAFGVSGGQQVGYGGGSATGYRYHALLWSGTVESSVDLHPTGFDYSEAFGVSGGQQAGYGYSSPTGEPGHALLWSGTAESCVDLNPSGFDESYAYGVSGGQQVGWGRGSATGGYGHALLWSGMAESYVDLNPGGFDGSCALGVSGDQQVGHGWGSATGYEDHALLWSGTAESCVDLHPSGFDWSGAHGVSGGQQVGCGYGSATGYEDHALLWSGTAESYVDLNPNGFDVSYAYGVSGGQQVGYGYGSATSDLPHALLWSGTPESYVDLQSFLPAGYICSCAYGIDSAGSIVGWAYPTGGGCHAVLWVPKEPPVASFEYNPEKPMVGGNIEFDASESKPEGRIKSYKWDWGDGQSEDVGTPKNTHEYASPGIYTVTLTVTDDRDMTCSTSKELDLTLKKGDILLCRDDMSFVPGKEWTHAGMYIGNEQVIEALKGAGVVISSLSEWSFTGYGGKYKTYVRALRVKTDDFTREKAVNFALGKIPQPYSLAKIILQALGWADKHVESNSWYCSELVWAAYQYASGGTIDLDQNLNGNAVAPDEIDESYEVELVGEHKEEKPETVWCWERLIGGIAYCPVDLSIIDPDDLILNRQGSQIAEGIYQEFDINGDASSDDFFAIPEPKDGDYLIEVIPEPGASPTDTYSLEVRANGVRVTLAEDVQVKNIPAKPYIVRSTETEIIPIIPATIDFDPDTLNLRTEGKWITVYIELPVGHGYDAIDIDVGRTFLEGLLEVQQSDIQDGVLMVKFDRQDVIAYIEVVMGIFPPEDVTLTVMGELTDGTRFEGSDTIRVIDPGGKK